MKSLDLAPATPAPAPEYNYYEASHETASGEVCKGDFNGHVIESGIDKGFEHDGVFYKKVSKDETVSKSKPEYIKSEKISRAFEKTVDRKEAYEGFEQESFRAAMDKFAKGPLRYKNPANMALEEDLRASTPTPAAEPAPGHLVQPQRDILALRPEDLTEEHFYPNVPEIITTGAATSVQAISSTLVNPSMTANVHLEALDLDDDAPVVGIEVREQAEYHQEAALPVTPFTLVHAEPHEAIDQDAGVNELPPPSAPPAPHEISPEEAQRIAELRGNADYCSQQAQIVAHQNLDNKEIQLKRWNEASAYYNKAATATENGNQTIHDLCIEVADLYKLRAELVAKTPQWEKEIAGWGGLLSALELKIKLEENQGSEQNDNDVQLFLTNSINSFRKVLALNEEFTGPMPGLTPEKAMERRKYLRDTLIQMYMRVGNDYFAAARAKTAKSEVEWRIFEKAAKASEGFLKINKKYRISQIRYNTDLLTELQMGALYAFRASGDSYYSAGVAVRKHINDNGGIISPLLPQHITEAYEQGEKKYEEATRIIEKFEKMLQSGDESCTIS